MVQISDNAGKLIVKRMTVKTAFLKVGSVSALNKAGVLRAQLHVQPGSPRAGDHVSRVPRDRSCSSISKSFKFIDGTTLDYDTSLRSKGFIFNNPNAKSPCGWVDVVQCDCGSASRCPWLAAPGAILRQQKRDR